MALMGFGDFDDIFGQADRMMNSMMRNMFGSMGDTYGLMDEMMMMMPRTPFPRFPAVPSPLALTNMPLNMFANASINNSFTSYSSVMTMSSGPSGHPQIYEETHSTRCGPDGVKETRSSVRDSASGYQKMSIGHHIQDRAHISSRTRNYYTGEEEQNEEYINLEEEEAENFNSEWKDKTKNGFTRGHHRYYRQLPQIQQNNDTDSDVEILALPAPPPSATQTTTDEQTQQNERHSSSHDNIRPIPSTSHQRHHRVSPIPSKHKLESLKHRNKRSKKSYKNK